MNFVFACFWPKWQRYFDTDCLKNHQNIISSKTMQKHLFFYANIYKKIIFTSLHRIIYIVSRLLLWHCMFPERSLPVNLKCVSFLSKNVLFLSFHKLIYTKVYFLWKGLSKYIENCPQTWSKVTWTFFRQSVT